MACIVRVIAVSISWGFFKKEFREVFCSCKASLELILIRTPDTAVSMNWGTSGGCP